MYLLDTNHCSYLIAKESTVFNKAIAIGTENLATCFIVHGELVFMAENSEQKQRNLTNVKNFLQYLRIYDNDLWIAAIALQHNLILVSADSDFQRIQTVRPLSVENWKGL